MSAWKTTAAAVLAATIMTAHAAGTPRWTHVECDFTWVMHDGNGSSGSKESHIYRFDAGQVDRWVPQTSDWYPECDAARGGFTEAFCEITENAISAVRRTTEGDRTLRLDSFRVNRLTGTYTANFQFSHGASGNASGTCRATRDPSAGMERRF